MGKIGIMNLFRMFLTEKEAEEWFAACRWPEKWVCSQCGNTDEPGGKAPVRTVVILDQLVLMIQGLAGKKLRYKYLIRLKRR